MSISNNCLRLKINMDAGDHVNTQLLIIIELGKNYLIIVM